MWNVQWVNELPTVVKIFILGACLMFFVSAYFLGRQSQKNVEEDKPLEKKSKS